MVYDPLDPQADPFHPPAIPTEVGCLHCGKEYESYLIEWRVETGADGTQQGFWCCPTPGCGGRGFGFDIFPTDPHYQDERGGWVCDEEEESDGEEYSEDEEDSESGDVPDCSSETETDEDAEGGRDEELRW